MKAIFSAIAAAGVLSMTACNTSALKEKETELAAKQHTIDSMNIAIAKKQVIDSMSEVTRDQYTFNPPIGTAPAVRSFAVAPRRTSVRKSYTRRYAAYSQPSSAYSQPVYSAPASTPAVYQQQPAQQQKRGWSAKAKGAVIGAGTGAAAGAIINGRNRLAGAVIGGVLGAGVGTGIGAILDHKNGR